MLKRLSQRSSAGFTLVEMVVSAAILALAVGGFYATFGGANHFAIGSRLNTSAKIVLGAAVNEALGTTWTSSLRKEVHQSTAGWVPYSIQNEGRFALPTPRADGEISLFTTPGGTEIIPAKLERWVTQHPERNDMLLVKFRVLFENQANQPGFQGRYVEPVVAYTVITRAD